MGEGSAGEGVNRNRVCARLGGSAYSNKRTRSIPTRCRHAHHKLLICNYAMYCKVSLPNDLSEFRESEPIGICKNINSIHDQDRGHRYLEDKRSKRGFPPTLRKTTWIFNCYCNAVFLKAIHLHLVWRFQIGITLEYWTFGRGGNKILSSSKVP